MQNPSDTNTFYLESGWAAGEAEDFQQIAFQPFDC